MSDVVVSIVIVNYNAGDLLARCINSVEDQTLQDFEIIIIDNASSDGSLDAARATSRIRIVRNERNIGFAAAQNQGIRLAQGRFIMPLNFDIEMSPTYLSEMVAAISQSPKVGSVTGKLMEMSAEGKRLNTLYSAGHTMPPNRFVTHRGSGERDRGQYDEMEEVFGAPGAAPLYRREMLADISFKGQFFDEALFTWYEDVDLDWRARWLGWRCLYTPKAVAYHIGHPEGHGGDLWKIQLQIRNRWLVILANDTLAPFNKCPAMLLYELSLLRYTLLNGYFSAYLNALGEFLRLIPAALAKRRLTLQLAR